MDAAVMPFLCCQPQFVSSFMRTPTILGNFVRTLATTEPIEEWSPTSLKEKLSR